MEVNFLRDKMNNRSTESNIILNTSSINKIGCQECITVLAGFNELDIHMQSKHEGINYICDQCEYKGESKGKLYLHKEIKHDRAHFYCDKCNYSYSNNSNLLIHKRTNHEGVVFEIASSVLGRPLEILFE